MTLRRRQSVSAFDDPSLVEYQRMTGAHGLVVLGLARAVSITMSLNVGEVTLQHHAMQYTIVATAAEFSSSPIVLTKYPRRGNGQGDRTPNPADILPVILIQSPIW